MVGTISSLHPMRASLVVNQKINWVLGTLSLAMVTLTNHPYPKTPSLLGTFALGLVTLTSGEAVCFVGWGGRFCFFFKIVFFFLKGGREMNPIAVKSHLYLNIMEFKLISKENV